MAYLERSNDFGDSFKSRKKIPSAEEPGNTVNLGGQKRNLNKLALFRTGASLTLNDDLLLFNNRIVVPPSLRKEALQAIHEGHQGIVRYRLRAKISVWWPGITQHIAQLIDGYPVCAQCTPLRREPLMATPLPAHPWQMVGTDLFEHAGHHYAASRLFLPLPRDDQTQ